MSTKFTLLHLTRAILHATGYLSAKAEAWHSSALERLEYKVRAKLFKIMDEQAQAASAAEEHIAAIRTSLAIQSTARDEEKKALRRVLAGVTVEQAIREHGYVTHD